MGRGTRKAFRSKHPHMLSVQVVGEILVQGVVESCLWNVFCLPNSVVSS